MKLKVEKKFIDKNTGETYLPEQIIEVSEERGIELLKDERVLVKYVDEEVKSKRRRRKKE